MVELVVVERVRWGNFAVSTRRLCRSAARPCLRFHKSHLRNIHAQMIFGRHANPGFRVNRATQMIMQITAFRHAEQEVTKLEGIWPRGLELKLRAVSGSCLRSARCG